MVRVAASLAAVMAMGPVTAETIIGARYAEPTTRYAHGILGDAVEYGALILERSGAVDIRIVLPDRRVFEDVAPRLANLDGDVAPEVIVVESDRDLGARLAVYDARGLRMATPFIGTRYRWLAPVGAADLDGDGMVEIAYVDRPHLARTLRVWRVEGDQLVPVAARSGLTNHRIGERDIAGGVRDCGDGPEMVVADADWHQVLAVRLTLDERLEVQPIGPHRDRGSFRDALQCRN